MKSLWLTGLCTILILLLPSLAGAQSAGVQEGVKLGKVYVTGENPGIRLLDKECGKVTFSVAGDAMTERRVTFKSDKYTVALVWRDLYAPFSWTFQ